MSEINMIAIGEELPCLKSIQPAGGFSVTVEWAVGARKGKIETVDLSPSILTFKLYRPLRDDEALFATVHLVEDGDAIAWGDGSIDMAATTVEQLAEEVMTNDDFAAFLKRNELTLDAAAGHLGISRRQVAYYAKSRAVPRLVALACEALERRWRPEAGIVVADEKADSSTKVHEGGFDLLGRTVRALDLSSGLEHWRQGQIVELIGGPHEPVVRYDTGGPKTVGIRWNWAAPETENKDFQGWAIRRPGPVKR